MLGLRSGGPAVTLTVAEPVALDIARVWSGPVVGFSGSLEPPPQAIPYLGEIIKTLSAQTVVVHGAADGIDHFAGLLAVGAGLRVLAILPFNRSRVPDAWRRACTHYIEAPNSDRPYRTRNAMVVDRIHHLYALPWNDEHDPRSARSGTWMTVRMARRSFVPVEVHLLSRITGTSAP